MESGIWTTFHKGEEEKFLCSDCFEAKEQDLLKDGWEEGKLFAICDLCECFTKYEYIYGECTHCHKLTCTDCGFMNQDDEPCCEDCEEKSGDTRLNEE